MEILTGLPLYLLSFVLVLTVLVFVHEFGHFLVARWNGVRVEVFSIGFGPELFGVTDKVGTRWKFSALPFGGYVKMFGHTETVIEPNGTERAMTAEEKTVSFHHKRVGQRSAIVLAGPLANFLFALVLLAGLFMVYGQQYSSPVVGTVLENSAADDAGILPGDRIVTLNGREISRFEDIAAIVQLGLNEPLHMVVKRNGERITLTAHPRIVVQTDNFGMEHRIGRLGIGSTGEGEIVKHGPLGAVWAAGEEIYRLTAGTLKAVWQMIAGTRPPEELGGVIRIAKMSGEVVQTGLISLIGFSALLSVNLGLINLFPVPMLDGGHLAFYAAEVIRGRPLGPRAQEWGFRVGLALVLTLMVFATWNDLVTLRVVAFFKGLIT